MTLFERREKVKARHKVLASVSGSGWHKDDESERRRRDAGEMPMAERPVAIQDDDRILIVAQDVQIVQDGLRKFLATDGAKIEANQNAEHVEKFAVKLAKRVLLETKETAETITVSTQEWNGVNFALAKVGISCVLTSASEASEET